MLRTFLSDESGATAIEYAVIAAMVSMAIVSALYGVRAALSSGFAAVSAGFKS